MATGWRKGSKDRWGVGKEVRDMSEGSGFLERKQSYSRCSSRMRRCNQPTPSTGAETGCSGQRMGDRVERTVWHLETS